MKLPARVRIWTHRAQNRYWDTLAVLSGYCNNCPWTADPGGGSGYSFWRCAYKRGHEQPHRYRNYTWTDDGHGKYDPIPAGEPWPTQPHDRAATPTRRQQRQKQTWLDRQFTAMREGRS